MFQVSNLTPLFIHVSTYDRKVWTKAKYILIPEQGDGSILQWC
uniref:Uncharacterized protein n=1 Tax=Anguilla anguilla TaxID=7936 RepID=A0A0E9XEK0_ANGAN